MSFCQYCGHQIPDDNSFCPNCGRLVKATAQHVEKEDRFEKFYDESYYSIDSDKKKSRKKPKVKKSKPVVNSVRVENNVQANYTAPTYTTPPVSNTAPTNNPQIYGYVPQENYGSLFVSVILFLLSLTGCCYGIPAVTIVITTIIIVVSFLGLFKYKFKGTIFLILAIMFSAMALLGSIGYGRRWGFFTVRQMEDGKDPILGETGVYVVPSSDDNGKTTVYYYYELTNTDEALVLIDQSVHLDFLDSAGKQVGSEYHHASYVLPGDTVYCFGIESLHSRRLGECVEIDGGLSSSSFASYEHFKNPIRSTDIEVSEASVSEEKYYQSVTGEITNNSDYNLDDPIVFVVFKLDGEVVLIDYTTAGVISSGETEDFTIKIFNALPEYDTIEVYVDVWSR